MKVDFPLQLTIINVIGDLTMDVKLENTFPIRNNELEVCLDESESYWILRDPDTRQTIILGNGDKRALISFVSEQEAVQFCNKHNVPDNFLPELVIPPKGN